MKAITHIGLLVLLVASCAFVPAETGMCDTESEVLFDGDIWWDHQEDVQVMRGTASFDSTELDSFIEATMEQYHVPGLAACIVKRGEVVWTGSYGMAWIEQGLPVEDTTLFYLSSVSKTVTAIALMQLWEEGLFDLDDDINDYLPFMVVNPNYPDSTITFRQLLLHTSSIADNDNVVWETMTCGDSPMALGVYLSNYLLPGGLHYDATLNFNDAAPGSVWDYCNNAIGLAGFLVEHITGTPFDQYCRDSIFVPLGMDETSWRLADLDSNNIAMPYIWNQTWIPYGHCHGFPDYPAVTMRSSTLQLARFLTAIMQWGEIDDVRILDSTTVDTIFQVYLTRPSGNGQGFVWLGDDPQGRWLWGHSGLSWGAKTAVMFTWQDSTGVICLANGHELYIEMIMAALFSFGKDNDGDGVVDGYDNCFDIANPGQEDTDDDSYGDVCDNCPEDNNPDQADSDGDGAGDLCDICPGFDDFADYDVDTVPDSCDNCPTAYNPDQLDSDEDGTGDACEWLLCGDADASGGVDIDDVVYLIGYIFSGGPEPTPYDSGDANCSGGVDIDDVVYLISYIFTGDNTPCDTNGDGLPDC